jgi:predicted RNA-binding protein Jag
MDAYEALQAIQRLARIALASEQGQPAEVLLDIQRRALSGIARVAEKALAKAP